MGVPRCWFQQGRSKGRAWSKWFVRVRNLAVQRTWFGRREICLYILQFRLVGPMREASLSSLWKKETLRRYPPAYAGRHGIYRYRRMPRLDEHALSEIT